MLGGDPDSTISHGVSMSNTVTPVGFILLQCLSFECLVLGPRIHPSVLVFGSWGWDFDETSDVDLSS